jgi:hypothetical protein
VELLCKAKSDKRIRNLELPADLNVSVQFAEKGSYRQDNILRYLGRWLEEWTPARQATNDWRILYLDMAKSHLVDDVEKFAESRGYVLLLHYGCTTGVAQINDTDLHLDLEAVYVELEQVAFHTQQLYDPGDISRTLQQVLDDLCGAWRTVDHTKGLRGHQKTGLSVALDGSEDHLVTREARLFWLAADMPRERQKALAEVDELVDSGRLTVFSDYRTLIQHPENPGVIEDEGAEFEGILSEGEDMYDDDDEDPDAPDFGEATGQIDQLVEVEVLPSDSPVDVADAVVAARRLQQLKRLRAQAVEGFVPAAVFLVDQEIGQLERGLRAGRRAEDQRVNDVLRRAMDQNFQKEAERIRKRQEETRLRKNNTAKVKLAVSKAKALKAKAAGEKKAVAAKLATLPLKLTPAEVGKPGAAGLKARIDALERVKLLSPKLHWTREARWPKVRDAFAAYVPIRFKFKGGDGPLGVHFVKELTKLMKALGPYYTGHSDFKKPGMVGSAEAFAEFFKTMENSLPKCPVEVVI